MQQTITLIIEEVISKYERKIYNLLLSLTRNTDDAKDLTQETFIQAYKKLHTIKDEKKSPPGSPV